jgi:hypothetical protein
MGLAGSGKNLVKVRSAPRSAPAERPPTPVPAQRNVGRIAQSNPEAPERKHRRNVRDIVRPRPPVPVNKPVPLKHPKALPKTKAETLGDVENVVVVENEEDVTVENADVIENNNQDA